MLDAGEGAQRRRDRRIVEAGGAGGGGRGGRVLAVVRARDQRLGRQLVVRGELDAARSAGDRPEAARHDRDVVRVLVLEDPQLRGPVRLEVAVPVEVVAARG